MPVWSWGFFIALRGFTFIIRINRIEQRDEQDREILRFSRVFVNPRRLLSDDAPHSKLE